MSEKSHVSIEQKVCAICGKTHNSGAILLDRRLKNSMERNTVTGWGHCKDCKKKLDEEYIAFVETTNGNENVLMKNEDVVRTGKIIWVKKHVASQIFNVDIKTPMAFILSDVSAYLESLIPKE